VGLRPDARRSTPPPQPAELLIDWRGGSDALPEPAVDRWAVQLWGRDRGPTRRWLRRVVPAGTRDQGHPDRALGELGRRRRDDGVRAPRQPPRVRNTHLSWSRRSPGRSRMTRQLEEA